MPISARIPAIPTLLVAHALMVKTACLLLQCITHHIVFQDGWGSTVGSDEDILISHLMDPAAKNRKNPGVKEGQSVVIWSCYPFNLPEQCSPLPFPIGDIR